MFFIRKPGSSKYEEAAIEFIKIFSGISDILGNIDENEIDELFTLIDIPDDKFDVFVGMIASFHIDKTPGLLVMKQIANRNRTKESNNDVIEFIKSLRNKELKDIINHSLNTLKLLNQMIISVDQSLLEEPMFLFSSFIKYITLLKKIKFGRTKILDQISIKSDEINESNESNESNELLNNLM